MVGGICSYDHRGTCAPCGCYHEYGKVGTRDHGCGAPQLADCHWRWLVRNGAKHPNNLEKGPFSESVSLFRGIFEFFKN